MNVFIAGARSIKNIDSAVQNRLMSIYNNNLNILIGDCYGVDTSVQNFFYKLNYSKVTVYASNGKVRNNIGQWKIKSINVPSYVKGFDFYKQKDIEMAKNADYGLMIWDGKSRGTLNNMINLTTQNKKTVVYISHNENPYIIDGYDALKKLIKLCSVETQNIYTALINSQKYEDYKLLALV